MDDQVVHTVLVNLVNYPSKMVMDQSIYCSPDACMSLVEKLRTRKKETYNAILIPPQPFHKRFYK